ncbi:MAG: hypothetical protein ABIR13_00365 [Polaromonas sp.]
MKKLFLTTLLASACTLALAKLPPLSPEAKAKAEETAAKSAWSGKVDVYQLCQSQDRVVAAYFKTAQAAGKPTQPALATPPCTNPGPFVYTQAAEVKPLEASGAHSPAETAASPPSSKTPEAVKNP